MPLTLADVDALAAAAHAGQLDKAGAPYLDHVRAVAAGLAPFGVGLRMAGLLHDVLEDTRTTARDLRDAGVPGAVVEIVQRVTHTRGASYQERIAVIAADYSAALVKIADNASNSDPARSALLPADQRERLTAKYAAARSVLWPAVPREDVAAILRIVNPGLLAELAELR